MRKQVSEYVRNCTDCQASKITKHVKPPHKRFGDYPKFSAIHVDFVGPLPPNKGKHYLFTVFDRGSRWFSAYPTSTATAEAAASALLDWTSNFGVPDILISDRGTHFEAQLFKEVTQKLGIEKRRVTAYHPAANGAVERQHRSLKESLKAKSESASRDWLKNLPLVLLGLRNAVSKDTGISAAQATFGRQLNIPGCIFDNVFNLDDVALPQRDFKRNDAYIPEALKTCTHVWLRKSGLQPSLSRPYSGPFKVISRNFDSNSLTVCFKGMLETVAMERVKPAWGLEDMHTYNTTIIHTHKDRKVTFDLSHSLSPTP